MIWPELRIDAISVGLMVVAVVPWLAGLFESLEFPGGWKISFRDLSEAAEAFSRSEVDAVPRGGHLVPSYLEVRGLDPELALVGLRIEIERRLQDLVSLHDVADGRLMSAGAMLSKLQGAGAIPSNIGGALREVIVAGNAAAHGAELPSGQRDFAFSTGPGILAWLDEAIADAGEATKMATSGPQSP